MSYVPTVENTSISYHDAYSYSANGQLWLCGGASDDASDSGLVRARSNFAWAFAFSGFSARLDYHGDIKEVTSSELKKILASA